MSRNFPSRKQAHTAVAKSLARNIPYTTPLEGVTLGNGSRAIRYVPTFKATTDEQRAIVTKAKFRCTDD